MIISRHRLGIQGRTYSEHLDNGNDAEYVYHMVIIKALHVIR